MSTVHLGPCSKSSGLARPSNMRGWCWISPPVPNPRRGISFLTPKEAPPSKYSSPRFSSFGFNSPPFPPQWFNHHKRCSVQVESQGNRIQTRRTSTFSISFGNEFTHFSQLVNTDTKAVVVESHRRITSGGGFFKSKTPRYMNLDITDEVVEYTELILITFLLVRKERLSERAKANFDSALLPSPAPRR